MHHSHDSPSDYALPYRDSIVWYSTKRRITHLSCLGTISSALATDATMSCCLPVISLDASLNALLSSI
jgi:hypothetical protein